MLSPTLFDIYTSDTPTTPQAPVKLTTYADEITITSTHINIEKANIQSYLHEIHELGQITSSSTQTRQRALPSHHTQQNTADNLNYK